MSKDKRSSAASKGWATRKAREQREHADYQERGQHEAAVSWHRKALERHGNVVIAEPRGQATMSSSMTGEPALELGELRVSLERVTFTPREGLHPASMAFALRSVLHLLGNLPIGRWEGWHKGQDEELSDCYSATIVRVVSDERPAIGPDDSDAPLLDVDPLVAVTS